MKSPRRIVTLSGSIRSGSSNSALLRAARTLSPKGTELVHYEGMAELPLYTPDLDIEPAPVSVQAFRALLKSASAVLISCPVYAHGVPGAFKNALDWVVSSGEFVEMPVGLIVTSSSGGTYVETQLVQTLTVMTAKVVVTGAMLSPLVRKAVSPDGKIVDSLIASEMSRVIATLGAAL